MEQKLCLLIDDDQDDQEIFQMCVHKLNRNIDCKTVDSGVEAIKILKSDISYIPNYIFLDVNMPMMNGIECLKELMQIRQLKNTKIFMYSTTSDGGVVMESKQLGAHDFLVKPSRTSDLRDKLDHIFEVF